ncbi:MAG TPA: AMP-binding protein [Stenotrophomonas sp.]|nr:AMP-binding protein [Stenotrophomonas sp.]
MPAPDSEPLPSHVIGPGDQPLLEDTVGALLQRAAQRWPRRPALVVPAQDARIDYATLDAAVTRLAAGLLTLGLEPGERIGMWSLNRTEWILMQFASARAGLILVNINPAYRSHELEYALATTQCRALVMARLFKTSDYVATLTSVVPELALAQPGQLHCARLPELRHVVLLDDAPALPGTWRFNDIANCRDTAALARVDGLQATLVASDPINIQFTSGTTGSPKGATLSHRNIVNNAFFIGDHLHLGPEDRVCIPVPFYHCFGMVGGSLACVAHGSCMVVPGEGFDPLATLQATAQERCTALYGVPTMFIAMLEHPQFAEFDLTALRTGIMAGSPCPEEVMRQVVTHMHMAEVTIAYGMTETSPVSFQTRADAPLARRVDSVGRAHPHVEARIVDKQGRIVPRGTAGELHTRGYLVMLGYWGDPERTAEVLDADGWMHTGDLATLDDEGYCRIVGRLKDMLIRGGENVYPREVEEFLYGHPAVADVQVFGVPDDRLGEEVCAWIRLRDGAQADAEAIREYCRQHIAHYKVPRYVEFVSEFPVTVTGKVQKYVMREVMAKRLTERRG